jgi:hypothetical protein
MRCAGNHVDLDAWMVAVWRSDRAGSDTKTSEVAAHVRLAQIAVDALCRPDRKPSSVQRQSSPRALWCVELAKVIEAATRAAQAEC